MNRELFVNGLTQKACCWAVPVLVLSRSAPGLIKGHRDIVSLFEAADEVVLAKVEGATEAKADLHSAKLRVGEYNFSVLYTFKGGDYGGVSKSTCFWAGGIDRGAKYCPCRAGQVALFFLKWSEFTERLHLMSQSGRYSSEDFSIPTPIAEGFLGKMKGRTSAQVHDGGVAWYGRKALSEIKELLLLCIRDHELFRNSYSMALGYLDVRGFDPVGRLAEIIGHDWRDAWQRELEPLDRDEQKTKLGAELLPLLDSHVRPGELAAIVLALKKRHGIGGYEQEFDWGWLLEKCREDLASDDKYSRYAAINALSNVGPAAKPLTPLLVRRLFSDPDDLARGHIVGAIVRIDSRSKAVRRTLLRALQDESPFVRARAAQSVEVMDDPPNSLVRPLAAALKDEDDAVRLGAAKGLRRMGPRAVEAIQALADAIGDESRHVRRVSAEALGRIGPAAKEAIPALTKMLESADPVDRRYAAGALREIERSR